MRRVLGVVLLALAVSSCQSTYYAAAEQVGYHKREILVDRVEDARDAQAEAEQQFESAQEHFLSLIAFDGGELQRVYDELSDEYDASRSAAEEVSDRIDAIEHVADALFDEWEDELGQYTNARLRADSERKLKDTQRRYGQLITVMRRSEERMQPVLAAMNDNVLYLKHNLNAQAVAALKTEFSQIDREIDALITEMRKAIATSDEFIESLRSES
jgi:Skp family chaperone for outer membrane proteins